MAESAGAALRRRRVALGLDLARAASLTALPEDYLRALEDDAPQRLPPGPYAAGFVKAYERALDRLESGGFQTIVPPSVVGEFGDRGSMPTSDGEDGPVTEVVVSTTRVEATEGRFSVPLAILRRVAVAGVVVFGVLLAGQLSVDAWTWWSRPLDASPVDVRVELRNTADLRVVVDGRLEAARQFAGGEIVDFHGRERVEFDVPDLLSTRVSFRGHLVQPQGHQDRPRKLVFVADGVER